MTLPTAVPRSRAVRRRPEATPLAQRLAGPDLARGAMLLLIALANVHVWTYGFVAGFRGFPVGTTGGDRVTVLASMTFVDGRAFPLFAALFGYGLVQVVERVPVAAGPGARTALLHRRAAWLIAIGAAHGLLLFTADIVAPYGLCALVVAGLVVRASDRFLLVVAAGLGVLALVCGALRGLPAEVLGQLETVHPSPLILPDLTQALPRLVEWAEGLLRVLGLAPAVLLGAWAARRGALTPGADARRLRRLAVWGGAVGILGAVPSASMAAAIWPDPGTPASLAAGALHLASGYAMAAAYLALFSLAARSSRLRRALPGRALVALGRRSLTGYLLQSVAFLLILDPAGLAYGDRLGLPALAALAAAVWLATLTLALLMERAGWRGPAERFLRWASYR